MRNKFHICRLFVRKSYKVPCRYQQKVCIYGIMEFIPHNHYQTVYLYFSVFQLVITNCFSIYIYICIFDISGRNIEILVSRIIETHHWRTIDASLRYWFSQQFWSKWNKNKSYDWKYYYYYFERKKVGYHFREGRMAWIFGRKP
jgi:hypothetical protein